MLTKKTRRRAQVELLEVEQFLCNLAFKLLEAKDVESLGATAHEGYPASEYFIFG